MTDEPLPRIPIEIRFLFGRVPVLTSQSKIGYWSLVESIANAIGPRDVIEWLCVKNLVDLTWNTFFYRRVEAGIIDVTRMQALISILGSILPDPSAKDVRKLASGWFNINSEARSMISKLFIEHNIDVFHVDAEAVRLNAQTLEQIERMLASMESRYRQAYRDIYFHRENLRISAEIESISTPKELPLIPSGELSDVNQVPEQDMPCDDNDGAKENDLTVGKAMIEIIHDGESFKPGAKGEVKNSSGS